MSEREGHRPPLVDRETQEKSKEELEHHFSQLLTQERVLEVLRELPDQHRDRLVGYCVEYLILFPDGQGLDRYAESLAVKKDLLPDSPFGSLDKFDRARIPTLINEIATRLHLGGVDVMEEKNAVVNYISEKYWKEGYLYHSFNGAFEQSIREHGLDPHVRHWDWNEVDDIRGIGARAGEGMLLGWANINSRGMISLGDEKENIVHYAETSPEWFAQFVGGGNHVPVGETKDAYHRRDYEAAKSNVTKVCDRLMSRDPKLIAEGKAYPNITPVERERLLQFFETYWQKFAGEGSSLKLAMVKRAALGEDRPGMWSYEDYLQLLKGQWASNTSLEDCVSLQLTSRNSDKQIKDAISPDDLVIVDLPGHFHRHPERKHR